MTDAPYALLRVTEADQRALEKFVFRRHPHREWAAFIRFGFRETSWGVLLCVTGIIPPAAGDLDRASDIVAIQSRYTLRVLDQFQADPLGVGVVHSHPQGCSVMPSWLDEQDLDSYFPAFFADFDADRPFASLIFGRDHEGRFQFSGRVKLRGKWLQVRSIYVVGESRLLREDSILVRNRGFRKRERDTTKRLEQVLGDLGTQCLEGARIAVVGASGTGSPALHLLLRERVGQLVTVDFGHFKPPNLERLHGSRWADVEELPLKVEIMRRMAAEINPTCQVTAIAGNMLDERVIDELLRCDLILSCTDTLHSRVVLGDLAAHYLLPSIDMGVDIDGGDNGRVKAQIMELVLNAPQWPCPHCDRRIDSGYLAAELMTDEEKAHRKAAAAEAEARGEDRAAYFGGERPELLTVGYLTTNIASQAVAFAVGWLTGAFAPTHTRYQMNLNNPLLGVFDVPRKRRESCSCGKHTGWADQALFARSISRPNHWPEPVWIQDKEPVQKKPSCWRRFIDMVQRRCIFKNPTA